MKELATSANTITSNTSGSARTRTGTQGSASESKAGNAEAPTDATYPTSYDSNPDIEGAGEGSGSARRLSIGERVEYLPVEWFSCIHNEEGDFASQIANVGSQTIL